MSKRTTTELKQEIAKLTSDFRQGSDPLWLRLRSLLRARAIEPDRAQLATLHSEDTNQWLGIVVTPERRVFMFVLDHLSHPVESAQFNEWEELTDKRADSEYVAYAGLIECALDMIPRSSSTRS